jgi:hypothetical protein
MHTCTGPWHRKGGQGTKLPISEFDIIQRGAGKGQIAMTCRGCRTKHEASRQKTLLREERIKLPVVEPVVEPIVPVQEEPVTPEFHVKQSPIIEREVQRWKVTIIKATEVIVEARDYLDAGVAAGDGEVIRIEKL